LVSATSEKMLKEGKEKVAFKATAIQEYLEQYLAEFRKADITLLVINQIRDKMNTGFVMGQDKSIGSMIDDTYHIPGGKYHKFMSFQALMLVSGKKWKYGSTSDRLTGKIVKITPTKNKQAPDRRQVDLIKVDDYGFSNIISLLEFLKSQGIMSGTMAGMKFSGELSNIFPKKVKLEKFVDTLIEDVNVLDTFYKVCFNQLTIYYKEHRRLDRYNPDIQKKIILFDAYKLKRHFTYLDPISVDGMLGEPTSETEEVEE
jgi:hypothetical protein